MRRYGGGTGSGDQQRINSKIETRNYPSTGLKHPYDKSQNLLIRFPTSFQSYFNCGQIDNRNTRYCPTAKSGHFDKTFVSQKYGIISIAQKKRYVKC